MELEHNIDFLINHQDIRQCHFPGDQNCAEDRYEEEACSRDEEGQYVYQSLSPDEVVEIHVGLPRCDGFFLLLILKLKTKTIFS